MAEYWFMATRTVEGEYQGVTFKHKINLDGPNPGNYDKYLHLERMLDILSQDNNSLILKSPQYIGNSKIYEVEIINTGSQLVESKTYYLIKCWR